MLSRIFWIGLGVIALIGGMIVQSGGGIFSWGDDGDHGRSVAKQIETRVDAIVDRSFDKMTVVTSDGQQIDVPPETKRELAKAVGRLVKAETDLALLKVRDSDPDERMAAETRRTQARADVERLKDAIERLEDNSDGDGDAIAQEVRQQIRDEVREAIRN